MKANTRRLITGLRGKGLGRYPKGHLERQMVARAIKLRRSTLGRKLVSTMAKLGLPRSENR